MDEILKMKGHILVELLDKDGKVVDKRDIDNTIVTVGKTYLATWLAAASQAGKFMEYMGLGTGTTAASSADTGLETPLATRVAGTITSSTNVWQNVVTFSAGVNTGAVTEAGLFSASSGGTMFARQVFAVINKTADMEIRLTWTITFS